MSRVRPTLAQYLAREYPLHIAADPDGGYVASFPDLPGCFTQANDLATLGALAEEARQLWIEAEYDAGASIPEPSYPAEYSGKFNLRLSPTLHRQLAEHAGRDGQSLNTYVSTLVARSDAFADTAQKIAAFEARLEERFNELEQQLADIQASLRYRSVNVPHAEGEQSAYPPHLRPVAA